MGGLLKEAENVLQYESAGNSGKYQKLYFSLYRDGVNI